MAKLKYDVTDAETRKQAKPGTYLTRIKSATHRPDPKNDIELVLTIEDGEFKGSQLWSYLNFGEASAWKLREFTDAMGMKPKGTIDTDKLKGKTIGVVVAADTWNGEYRARVNKWLDPEAMEADEDEDEGEDLDDEEDVEDDEEDEDEEEVEAVDYSSMSLKELVAEAAEREIKLNAKQKKDKDAIIELLEEADEEGEDEEEDEEPEPPAAKSKTKRGKAAPAPVPDDDEDEDEDEDEEEEEDEEPEDYNEWSEDELREELESRGLKKTGSKKLMIGRLEKDDAKSGTKPF